MPRALWLKAPLALARHRVGLLAVLCAALLVATGAASGPLLSAGAESEALQSKLQELTPLGGGLVIDRPLASDPGNANAVAQADARRRAAARALGRTLPSVGRPVVATTAYAQLQGHTFDVGNPLLVVLMARTGATQHVHTLAGGGSGVWLSRVVARVGGVHAGGRVTFVRPYPGPKRAKSVTLRLAAVYRPLDTDLGNPYWVNFTARIRAPNPDASPPPSFALVSPAEIYRLAHEVGGNQLANVYEFPIDARSMTPGRARNVAAAFRRVEGELGRQTELAAGLGCDDLQTPCRVSSELTQAVQLAAAGNAGLRPLLELIGGFCTLLALAAGVVAGAFTGRRRAAEARLSLVGGEPPAFFFARAVLEALLPAALGAAGGFALAAGLVGWFTPSGSVDSSVVQQAGGRVALSVLATAIAVGAGTTLARGRLGVDPSRSFRLRRVPWELPAVAVAGAAWLVLSLGGGLVQDQPAGSHPRLGVLFLPALVAAPLAGVVGRALLPLGRRITVAPIAAFLALRRVGAARGLVVALTVTIAAGTASLAFAQILHSSLTASSREKALVSNGSDVQGLIDPGRVVPATFPYPVTKVAEAFDAGRLESGTPFEVVAVDPASLARVVAAHWPRDVRSAVQALASSTAGLPAIGVGVGPGRHAVTIGGSPSVVEVVARVRAFPGMQPSEPLLVLPFRALARPPAGALTYVWASGPPRLVSAALAGSALAPSYLTALADFSRDPDVANVARTYGFLQVVALAILLLALVGLLLYLSGRERSQLVTSALLRRMGLRQARQALSVALEAAALVAVATFSGLVAALATAGAIVGRVDPLPAYAPAPVAQVPWAVLLGTGLGAIAAAAAVAGLLTLVVRRTDVGEALRAG